MSRETDKKIAEWLGYKSVKHCPCGEDCDSVETPDGIEYLRYYSEDDADAVSLLPVLVERGHTFELIGGVEDNQYLSKEENRDMTYSFNIRDYDYYNAPTIAAAISSAVCELIEKEKCDA